MTSINLIKNLHNINFDCKYKTKKQYKKIVFTSLSTIKISKILIKDLEKYKENCSSYYKIEKKILEKKIQHAKFEMCIHKLKMFLPDHLIYKIGNFL